MTLDDVTQPGALAVARPVRIGRIPRSVIGATLGMIAIVAVAVAMAFFSSGRPAQFPADTAEGTFQRYLAAIQDDDLDAAYGYFSTSVQQDMSLATYRRVVRDQGYYADDSRRIALDRVDVTGDRADLHLLIHYPGGVGLFGGGGWTEEREVPLVREDGGWRIAEPLAGLDPAYIYEH